MSSARFSFCICLLLLASPLGGCSVANDPVDLRSLVRGSAPNEALACPAGICAAVADFETPYYDLPKESLRDVLASLADAEPRMELVAQSADLDQRVYVQRSRLFGFADTVRVQLVASPEGTSAILHSKAGFGFWDLGVNRQRIERWLSLLDEAAKARLPATEGRTDS